MPKVPPRLSEFSTRDPEKSVFDKRERVTVKIDAKNNDGQPVAANLSFAVTNNDKIGTTQYAEDFRTYMLLRSDLRGHIEQPNYYFEDTTAKARLALDNLLMTQGWRRFDWREKPATFGGRDRGACRVPAAGPLQRHFGVFIDAFR